MLKGSCLCGAVRYEVGALIEPMVHCHCSQCRKSAGASFTTNASVRSAAFRWTEGEAFVGSFESSPGVKRCFCTRCGSPLIKRKEAEPATLRLRLGTLDSDPGIRPAAHIYVNDRAPWTEIEDGLPQYERDMKGPPLV
jgi:hypothetical protein